MLNDQRSGQVVAVDVGAIVACTVDLKTLANRGWDLDCGFRFNPRTGIYLPNAVWNESRIPVCSTDEGGQRWRVLPAKS